MRKLTTLFLLIISLSLNCIAQDDYYELKSPNNLFKLLKLKRKDGKTTSIITPNNFIIPLNNTRFCNNKQLLVITGNNAFITIDGTGIVYENTDSVIGRFKRVDSTVYWGNNFSSISFAYNNQLYNLGGYGFWRSNGQLRQFSPFTKDWMIIPINREIPVDSKGDFPSLWHDEYNNKVFALESFIQNQSINNSTTIIDSVYQLDLKTKTWATLGKITNNNKDSRINLTTLTNTEFGLLLFHDKKIKMELWNVNTNEIMGLTKEVENKFPISEMSNYIYWYDNSYIYTYNLQIDKLDSISFSSKNIIRTNTYIYERKGQINFNYKYIALIGLLITILITLFYWKRKTKIIAPKSNTTTLNTATDTNSLFSEIEKGLLGLIINNINKQNRLTSIDEVNYTLGISNKSLNMQKRTRSDVISSINSKYQIYFKSELPLILRQNSDLDQRVKEFYIETENINKIINLI